MDQLIHKVIDISVDEIRVPEWTKLEAWRDDIRQRAEARGRRCLPQLHRPQDQRGGRASGPGDPPPAELPGRLAPSDPGGAHRAGLGRARRGIVTGQPDLTDTQANFLHVFDLASRRRRLYFLVEYVNQLYPPSPLERPLPPRADVDAVKTEIYALMG